MSTYIWRNGDFVDKRTGALMQVADPNAVCMPRVMRDTPEYHSPIDGRLISSRSARREDLKRNGCIEIDPPRKPKGYKNKAYAKKHNLPLREDAR